MPTYDFECKTCGHKFSTMISIKDKDKVTCPECKGKRVRQVFTAAFAINVKGDSGSSCGDGSCSSGGFG